MRTINDLMNCIRDYSLYCGIKIPQGREDAFYNGIEIYLSDFKYNLCKQQRENCADYFNFMSNTGTRNFLKEKILSSNEPD